MFHFFYKNGNPIFRFQALQPAPRSCGLFGLIVMPLSTKQTSIITKDILVNNAPTHFLKQALELRCDNQFLRYKVANLAEYSLLLFLDAIKLGRLLPCYSIRQILTNMGYLSINTTCITQFLKLVLELLYFVCIRR